MGDYICMFKVLVYDTITEENVVEHGMCFADSFASAAAYLEKTLYGEELIEIQHLELFDTCPVFSAETWNTMKKELSE